MCQEFLDILFDKHWTFKYNQINKMNTHRIHRVAKLTGLSKDVIRVWERRFDLLKPTRGTNRYRNYSDEDVALLRHLKEQLDAGGSIGELSKLGREELLRRARASAPQVSFVDNTFSRLLRELLSTLDPFDRVTFEKRLNGAVAVVPFEEALHGILLPLQEQIGRLWHDGHVNIAIEHYVTKQIQQKIFSAMNQLPVAEFGAKVVVACPPGEEHDVAALAVAYRCRVRGCRVYYLGANVPIASLANLCRTVKPDLTIISFPLALSDENATELVENLTREVAPTSRVAVGGNGALGMRALFERAHIEIVESFAELDLKLDRLMRQSLSQA
jgi:DNA-binding transcriptional MerR regulator/methylmalonyl-CoA mutase cobalamin-binding subunit